MTTLLEKISSSCMIKVVRVKKDVEQLYEITKNFLTKNELTQYKNIKNSKRKREWLSVRLLLSELLGEYKEITYDKYNNPDIEGEYNISVTHSKDIVGLILSKNQHIGIDSEFLHDRILKTAHKFITQEELESFNNQLKLKKIYLNWCGKETLFKIKGGGGIDFKENFKIKLNSLNELGSMTGFYNKEGISEKYVIYYQFIKTYNEDLLITWHS